MITYSLPKVFVATAALNMSDSEQDRYRTDVSSSFSSVGDQGEYSDPEDISEVEDEIPLRQPLPAVQNATRPARQKALPVRLRDGVTTGMLEELTSEFAKYLYVYFRTSKFGIIEQVRHTFKLD